MSEYDPNMPMPPAEIMRAAEQVKNWAVQNGMSDMWAIGPVCSRSFAEAAKPNGDLDSERWPVPLEAHARALARHIYLAIVSETKQRVKSALRDRTLMRISAESLCYPIMTPMPKGPFCPFCKHHHFLNVDCPKGKQ